MIKFETVSRFENSEIDLIPTRKTEASAGYDMYVAEEIIIPPHKDLIYTLIKDCMIINLLFQEIQKLLTKIKLMNQQKVLKISRELQKKWQKLLRN